MKQTKRGDRNYYNPNYGHSSGEKAAIPPYFWKASPLCYSAVRQLDSASLHLARGHSSYERPRPDCCLHASMTQKSGRGRSHCSLFSRKISTPDTGSDTRTPPVFSALPAHRAHRSCRTAPSPSFPECYKARPPPAAWNVFRLLPVPGHI